MFKFSRIFIIYVIAAPLALLLGYLVASPNKLTVLFIGLLLALFAVPVFLRWHHALLIIFWNSVFTAAFLPGSPDFWLPFAAISFCISFLDHIVFQRKFLHAPELTIPLLFVAAVVLFTAWYRGGIGLGSFGGGTIGGRYYIFILLAIAGYFAFTARPIAPALRQRFADCFLLAGATSALSNLIFMAGPAFYFLYHIVPAGFAMVEATSEFTGSSLDRITGVGAASTALLCFALGHFGIRGLFDFSKPWRFGLIVLTGVACLFGGFRSVLALLCIIFAIHFYLEGLMRTHYLPIIVGLAILVGLPIVMFSNKMPGSMQRAISFLPVKVNPDVLADAKSSSEWRFDMWAIAAKEIPKYLLVGKGYGMDATTLFLVNEAQRTGSAVSPFEGFLMAGDYHSGPLSVIIPFGIPGVIGFLWTLLAGWRVLYLNYRFGDPKLRNVNTILLAFYLAECFSFFFIFGALSSEFYVFTGICGFSVSLNGGVKRRAIVKHKRVPVPQMVAVQPG